MRAEVKTKWKIDPNHSEVQFKVKHLAISNVSGVFNTFHGDIDSEDEDFTYAVVHFEIDTKSIDTNNSERDKHLTSPAFLNTEKFPKIIFDGFICKKDGEHYMEGELTVLETKRSVKMEVELTGVGIGRFGDTRAGFEANAKINRKDFGLSFGLLTETGNLVVGEEVKLHADMQLIKQTA